MDYAKRSGQVENVGPKKKEKRIEKSAIDLTAFQFNLLLNLFE